ncbi:carboxylesterase family protein [Bacillus niameyensis]|uniref:carboxylesterase family protein n=1 Tax=Bacillus niameyensis TaxID=1522308 RepID=UPI00078181EC|nr:alpha/beta hydrolase-fold protein [Bacillus niameyensis]
MTSSRFAVESREAIIEKFLPFTYKSMPYRLYVPENYDPNFSYPLIMFLHGGGERGDDNLKHLTTNNGAIIWAIRENQAKHPTFVLAPQARDDVNGGFGLTRDVKNGKMINLSRVFDVSDDLLLAHEILETVIENYTIDRKRLYITGLSQGGFGTYNLNILYPDLFAAMIPIAGGGDPEKAVLLKDKPIWNFHAEDDGIIPVEYSRRIIKSIENAGGKPIYTEYSAIERFDHGSWVPAYENQEMIDWLFQQVMKE